MSYLKHKPGSIEEMMANQAKKLNDNAYQDMFKKELEKAGRGIGAMSLKEKKDFFNKIDDKYKAKNEAVNEGITSPSGQISQKNKDLLKVNNYITVKGKVYVIDKVSLKNGVYTMKAFDKNGKMHTISSKDVDSVEHWKNSLKVASYDPKNEQVDNPYAVGMAQAMKAKDDKPPLKKSTITKAHDIAKSIKKDEKNEIDKFHTSLDKLVHKTFGHSSDEKKEDSQELQKDKTDNYKEKNKESIKEASYPHKMYSKDGKEVEAKTPEDHKKYAEMGYTHKNETHSFMTKDMNKSKKDAKGEKEIVDPAPKMKFKEAYKKAKKEAMNTVGDATADQANQRVGEGPKENDPDIKKPKAKADTGSKATPVDTSPEVEYKN